MLAAPITLSLFRPATDNDNRDRNGARLWRKAGLNNLTQKVVSLKEEKTSATVRAEILNGKGQKVGMADFVYALDKNCLLYTSRAAWDKFYAPIIDDFYKQNLTGKELANWKFQRYMRCLLYTSRCV